MANFAVIGGNTVVNVIVAEDLETAEMVTGMKCAEYTDENPAAIGWSYVDGAFVAPVSEEVTDVEGS